jgi:hypothetical protein
MSGQLSLLVDFLCPAFPQDHQTYQEIMSLSLISSCSLIFGARHEMDCAA